ncbi:glycosyltransferase family 2 protein [Streptococcus thoraltensis]|uniref:glycosyltransferase family 2 protein n=1 Tax=Streptococcus thoraltensis TaxID=55085 RepID=UPI00035EE6B0|nr:glycosyltransferase family 2 protein [Streptococcus thoraltensis]MDY4761097.1 glycosyltransferase family 2 protein [Streptococcus thoraltensis]
MKVNILLSTYNGEKYLSEQIESIQAQTFKDWNLLIRDDGSKDSTTSIIREIAEEDDRIRFINDGQNENYGVIKSFYHLVKFEKADYYFFSDQDDVWLPEKLEITLQRGQKENPDKPLLVYTDLRVVNENLEILQESMIKAQSHHANTELVQELTENTVTGGTMMINKALADKWQVYENLLMHDWYLALLAASLGKLVYIDQPTQLYRQHEANVLGARTEDKKLKLLRLGPKAIFTKYWQIIHDSQKQAMTIVELFGRDLTPRDRLLIEQFYDIDRQSILRRAERLIRYGYSKNQLTHKIVFKILILTNWYNRNR